MPSNDGLPELLHEWYQHHAGRTPVVPMPVVTTEEQDRIADGESYCFRCGKPANSFESYDNYIDMDWSQGPHDRDEAVRAEEGTYNPATNRFACDGCYIAIGMPSAPGGWKAP